jgi:isopenicillin-N N-acyltransferase-like protein
MTAPEVSLISAAGRPFEVGYRHGAARGAALRAFIDDGLCRINRLAPEPVSIESLRPALAEYGAVIAAATPRLSEEIDGLARGAGLSRELAVLLQVRREIIGFQRVPARGDCTTYASLTAGPDGGPVLAQTVDLNGDLDDQIAVLDVSVPGSARPGSARPGSAQSGSAWSGSAWSGSAWSGSRRALVLSFGGLLGYLGVNSDGLAIGLNLVLGGTWGPGLPPYLAIRHLLDSAGSVAEALAILRGLPLASSRSLTLCDPGSVACVEILDGRQRLVGGTEPVHTNHFLHPDFAAADALNAFARNSSLARLKAGEAGLARFAESARAGLAAGVEDHFALLARPPMCVAGTGDIRRERTVAAVVLLPDRGELHVRPGDPSRSCTQTFRLGVGVGAGTGGRA